MSVYLRNPKDGAIYQYADKDATAAKRAGLTLVSPEEVAQAEAARRAEEEAGSLTGKLKTAGESFAANAVDAFTAVPRLLTAGATKAGLLSENPLADMTGRGALETIAAEAAGGDLTGARAAQDYAAAARLRATTNPLTAGGAGTLGQITGLAASGGAGLARGAGTALTKAAGGGLFARLGGAAATGTIEGAPLGLSAAQEQAWHEHRELTADQALAAGGIGALLGGGLSFAVTGAAEGALAIKQRILGDEGVRAFLQKFANERAVKALGARATDVRKLGPKVEEVGDTVLQYKFEGGERLFKSGMNAEELAEATARAIKVEGKRIGSVYKAVDNAIASGEAQGPNLGRFFEELDANVIKPLVQSDVKSIRGRAARVLDEVGSLRNATAEGEQITIERLVKARQELQDVIQPLGKRPAQFGLPPPPPEHAMQLVEARKLLQNEIDRTIEAAGFGEMYQGPKRLYENLKDANKIASRAAGDALGNRIASPTDYMSGIGSGIVAAASGVGGVGSALTGGLSTALHKVARERGSSVAARAADSLATMAERWQKQSGKALDGLFDVGRAVQGPRSSLIPIGAAAAGAPTVPRALELFMGKHQTPELAYERRIEELHAAAQDSGGGVRNAVANSFGAMAAREQAALMAMTVAATTGVNYLISKSPGGWYQPNTLTPLTDKTHPSRAEIQEFARTWAAVMKPQTVLEDLKAGQATPAQIQALQAVHPRSYADLRMTALDRIRSLDVKGETIPLHTRMQLDTLLDLNGAGERTMTDAFVARYSPRMSDAAARAARQQERRPRPGPTSLGKAVATQTSRFLGGAWAN